MEGFSTFWGGAGGFFEGFLAALAKWSKHCFWRVWAKILVAQYLAVTNSITPNNSPGFVFHDEFEIEVKTTQNIVKMIENIDFLIF